MSSVTRFTMGRQRIDFRIVTDFHAILRSSDGARLVRIAARPFVAHALPVALAALPIFAGCPAELGQLVQDLLSIKRNSVRLAVLHGLDQGRNRPIRVSLLVVQSCEYVKPVADIAEVIVARDILPMGGIHSERVQFQNLSNLSLPASSRLDKTPRSSAINERISSLRMEPA